MLMLSLSIPLQRELPPGAWIALVVIVIFIFILNFALFTSLKRRNNPDAEVIQRLMHAIRKPGELDNEMRSELRERVKRLADEKEPTIDR